MELDQILESYKPRTEQRQPEQKYQGLRKLEERKYEGGTSIMYWM